MIYERISTTFTEYVGKEAIFTVSFSGYVGKITKVLAKVLKAALLAEVGH